MEGHGRGGKGKRGERTGREKRGRKRRGEEGSHKNPGRRELGSLHCAVGRCQLIEICGGLHSLLSVFSVCHRIDIQYAFINEWIINQNQWLRDGASPEKASFIWLGVHRTMVSVRVVSTQRDPHFSQMHATMSRTWGYRMMETRVVFCSLCRGECMILLFLPKCVAKVQNVRKITDVSDMKMSWKPDRADVYRHVCITFEFWSSCNWSLVSACQGPLDVMMLSIALPYFQYSIIYQLEA